MPVARNVATAAMEREDSRASPSTPWPLVQPEPMREPKPTSKPASAMSGQGVVISICGQSPKRER